jgi:hypothetical protein
MSESDTIAIIEEMKSLRAAVEAMRGEIRGLLLSGCSKASSHADVQRDHEARLRDIEKWMTQLRGTMYGISAVVSFACTLAGLLFAWLVLK